MIDIEQIIKEVSAKTGVDKGIVDIICKHPFLQTVDIMKSDNTQDIMFNGLFKFKLKRRYKEDKSKPYKSK